MSSREEEIRRRQAECDCNPNFHVCTAIAEMESLAEHDRQCEKNRAEERLEQLRIKTLAQAEVVKQGWPGLDDFCNQVIELLSREEEDGG
jgi:hypothetical protein